jgi:hypothetical protein
MDTAHSFLSTEQGVPEWRDTLLQSRCMPWGWVSLLNVLPDMRRNYRRKAGRDAASSCSLADLFRSICVVLQYTLLLILCECPSVYCISTIK